MNSFIETARVFLNDEQLKDYGIALVAGPNDDYADEFNIIAQ